MMKRVIFLHGFFASGSCIPALAMREALKDRAEVLSPDLPMHPADAVSMVCDLCRDLHPDVIAGNSNGAFIGQMVASKLRIPALLGNPHMEMTKFLSARMGWHRYKSPRADGVQDFNIDSGLVDEFAEMEVHQFDNCSEVMRDRIWGLFGDNDTLAHYESLFLEHYSVSFHFPGNHTPTAEEVGLYYVPLIERLADLK